jgi:cellulose synthase/poly-beta-1,6-N-acetylglucosamine synthase-like glycosyltransferase
MVSQDVERTGTTFPAQDLVTVVIPARDEQDYIAKCLTSVLEQDWKNLQIVVVDGCSRDRTADIVAEFQRQDARVELLDNPARTTPSALNIGLAAARGKWFVRVDGHSSISANYVSCAVARLKEDWDGVGGRVHSIGRTPVGRAVAFAMGSRFGVGTGAAIRLRSAPEQVEHIIFGCYWTDRVRMLGGWDERLTSNQDVEFNFRLRAAGGRLLYEPSMVVTYHCRQSLKALFVQYRRYGMGKTRVLSLHHDAASPRHLAPAALVLAGITAAGAAARGHPAPLAAVGLPYGAALAAAFASSEEKLDPAARARLPAVLLTMHVGYGIGFLRGLPNLVHEAGAPVDERR